MKKVLLAILTAITLAPVLAQAYMSPGSPRGYVSDFGGMLSEPARQEIETNLAAYQQQTGIQMAVVTVPNLGDETIENFAVGLFEEWGIGKADQDNGVLFLVALNERQTRIEVGYGLEGILTDVESKNIVNNIVAPNFKEGNFDNGIKQTVIALISAVGAEESFYADDSGQGRNIDYGYLLWLGIFALIWLGSVLARSRSWWLGGVLGGLGGAIVGLIYSVWFWLPILIVAGLVFDYLVSTKFKQAMVKGGHHNSLFWFLLGGGPHWWDKGGRGGFGGGGFGGFGGGSSGGGGASGSW